MVLELKNVLLTKLEDRLDDEENIAVQGKLLKKIDSKSLHGLPVFFKRGAVRMQIGFIDRARKGREDIFGDLILDLDGLLDVVRDGKELKGTGFTFSKV